MLRRAGARLGPAFAALFLLGAGLRAVDLWRPIDGTIRDPWRECDIGAIARNYDREGMNLLYPRIDWRGDGPGYAEMEFPLFPWLIAVSYRLFGTHEVAGRLITYAFSLGALAVYFSLANDLLPAAGSLAAGLFFATSPLVIRISNSLQPDGLMMLAYLLAAYAFLRWLDQDTRGWFWLATGLTALAILAKANAAHIGLAMLGWLLHRRGLRALADGRVWAFGALSLLPGALWYAHAHSLWLRFGNSLGLSNESHWIGLYFFQDPSFAVRIGRTELVYVWAISGVIVAAAGLLADRSRDSVACALYWLASVAAFYLLAVHTVAATWGAYYHAVAVPAVGLLFGAGVEQAIRLAADPHRRRLMAAVPAALAGIALLLALRSAHPELRLALAAAFGAASAALAFGRLPSQPEPHAGSLWRLRSPALSSAATALAVLLLPGAVVAAPVLELRRVVADFHPSRMQPLNACARQFAPLVPPGTLIVSSGGKCADRYGRPLAYNASYMFYWMDRKGFSVCEDEQSLERLESLVSRGARYFVAERDVLRAKPGFEEAVRGADRVVAECPEALLFDLSQRATPGPPSLEPGYGFGASGAGTPGSPQ